MEQSVKSFRRDVLKSQRKTLKGVPRTFDEAMEDVREYVQLEITQEIAEKMRGRHSKDGIVKQDKAFLRDKERTYRDIIEEAIDKNDIVVIGYEDRMKEFVDLMVAEFAGYSTLEKAFRDPDISDIFVINWNTIFVEKNGENVRYDVPFKSQRHAENVIKRFVQENSKQLDSGENKIVNFELYEDRGCAISPIIAQKGYSVTFRKHKEDHITLDDLLKGETLNQEIADLLGMFIDGEANIICAGITGSGKTTTIRALLDHSLENSGKRALVCEDTPELFLKNPHTLELCSFDSTDPNTAVSLRELVYTALRLKPKYIIVGEVRGEEAEAAVEAMETGHSTIFTMHAGHSYNAINRLVTKYLMAMPSLGTDVVERIVGSAIDYIFIQDNIPGIGRKISRLDEITYDFENKRAKVRNIFEFDFEKKDWVWNNDGWLDEEKISKMLRRGVPYETLKKYMKKGA